MPLFGACSFVACQLIFEITGNWCLTPISPDPISNSEVKTLSANASVGSPHVRGRARPDFRSVGSRFATG
jgi:hypothetical protein